MICTDMRKSKRTRVGDSAFCQFYMQSLSYEFFLSVLKALHRIF